MTAAKTGIWEALCSIAYIIDSREGSPLPTGGERSCTIYETYFTPHVYMYTVHEEYTT